MAPSIVYTRASTSLSASSNPSVLRSLTSPSIKRYRNTSVRNLWWWTRHGTCSSNHDESMEERLQKHQKIMRHRYSKAMRRRAMWDRDDNNSLWLWRVNEGRSGQKWDAYRAMSSTDPKKVNLNNDHKPTSRDHMVSKETEEFETFKAMIDRAVEKDPYGTLFGRRLESPTSENNSSWISWLFNGANPAKEPDIEPIQSSVRRKIEIEVLDKNNVPVKAEPQNPSKVDSTIKAKPIPEVEYVYDPISGRKVPRSSLKDLATAPPRTFLETIFGEHGSVPDKPTKQNNVYGYIGRPKSEPKDEVKEEAAKVKNLENSRAREYQQLRAATLGNHIDTTAEFGGKFEPEVDTEVDGVKKDRQMPELDENAPLFSGTTYESKADEILDISKQPTSWLQKEGFQEITMTNRSNSENTSSRLEPSLDRMQSKPEAREQKFTTRLQPAIDRVQLVRPKVTSLTPETAPTIRKTDALVVVDTPKIDADKEEDIDLLRASDIRAATRTARTTKHETALAKAEKRGQLETEFEQRQIQIDQPSHNVQDLKAYSTKLTQNIENVRKHAEKYPDGIVAKAMKTVESGKDKFKEYERPYNPGRIDLTERLNFKPDALEKLPSIFKRPSDKPRMIISNTENVKDEVSARKDLTESLRLSSKTADEAKKRDDYQIQQLALGIREAFESEQGPIDLSLAQNSPPEAQAKILNGSSKSAIEAAQSENKVQCEPLPDTGPHHTEIFNKASREFEAELEEIHRTREQIKELKQRLHNAELERERERMMSAQRAMAVNETQDKVAAITRGLRSVWATLREADTKLHDVQRSRVTREPTQTLDRTTQKDEVKTSIPQSLPETASKPIPSSPYLLLIYSKSSGEVNQTGIDRLPWTLAEKTDKANPIKIMSNLNYPAAFVTHFAEPEKSGYELSSGGGDMLVFQKKSTTTSSPEQVPAPVLSAPKVLRDIIAAEEASAQPEITETIAQPKRTSPKHAATVLDEIPSDIPIPGPSAPTAPPTNPTPNPISIKKSPKPGPKVRRQEVVFSATIPVRTAQKQSQSQSQKEPNENPDSEGTEQPGQGESESLFNRGTRTLKRGVLGVAAFGVAAYTIGVVAEGIGAQAQVEGNMTVGPRRKVVMPTGQRAGIYSTESSRTD